MAAIYWIQSCAYQTTAAPAVVATGTTIKTLLQVATPSNECIRVVEWGVSFDTPASTSVVQMELVQTDAAASSGTSITPEAYDGDASFAASQCAGGAALTCYQPSSEGNTTATRTLDMQLIVPPYVYVKQWPLGREPYMGVSKFLRIRVTASVTCNAYAYVIWEE